MKNLFNKIRSGATSPQDGDPMNQLLTSPANASPKSVPKLDLQPPISPSIQARLNSKDLQNRRSARLTARKSQFNIDDIMKGNDDDAKNLALLRQGLTPDGKEITDVDESLSTATNSRVQSSAIASAPAPAVVTTEEIAEPTLNEEELREQLQKDAVERMNKLREEQMEALKKQREERQKEKVEEEDQDDRDRRLRMERLRLLQEENEDFLSDIKDQVHVEKFIVSPPTPDAPQQNALKQQLEQKELLERQKMEDLERERIESERKAALEKERILNEQREKELKEAQRAEEERKLENERKQNEQKEKLEKERMEKERLDKLEKERLENERMENEKLEKERIEKEQIEKERLLKLEQERLQKEQQEKEIIEQQRLEKERLEKERIELEKKEAMEKERLEKEQQRLEQERLEKQRLEELERKKQEEIAAAAVKVEKPSIDQSRIASLDVPYICSLLSSNEPALKSVTLKGVSTSQGISICNACVSNTNLVTLDFTNSLLDQQVVSSLCTLIKKNKTIKNLYLENTLITEYVSILDALEENDVIADMTLGKFATEDDENDLDELLGKN